jgi:type IV pilus assembly protein PilC
MPSYIYTAKNKKGETEEGHLEAKSQPVLAFKLRKKGLTLISAEKAGQKSFKDYFSLKQLSKKLSTVSLEDKMLFSRHLSIMLKAGLSLSESLQVLAKQASNPKFRKIVGNIEESVRRGKSFSESLAEYSKVFDSLYTNMIKVGEEGGSLSKTLNILAKQMKKDHELISRVKGAMMYPAVIVIAMIGIGIMMMIVVVPKLTGTFEEMGMDLPVTTQIVISISDFLKNYWYIFILGVVGLIVLIHFLLKNKKIKKTIQGIYLKLPIFGPLVKKINAARFARTTSSLIESGVSIVKTLKISAGTLGNLHFKDSLISASKEVQKGKELSACLSKYENVYNPMIIQMIKVGEETGAISDILGHLAGFYEEEVDNTTKNLSSIIEPVLMVAIGGAVGFFAVSMLQPMYSMMGGL